MYINIERMEWLIYLPGNLYSATSLQLISNMVVRFCKLAQRHIVFNGHSYNISWLAFKIFRLSNFQQTDDWNNQQNNAIVVIKFDFELWYIIEIPIYCVVCFLFLFSVAVARLFRFGCSVYCVVKDVLQFRKWMKFQIEFGCGRERMLKPRTTYCTIALVTHLHSNNC